MISLCVFSRNRPMQLDAFLKSLVNAPYITDVNVLYTYDEFHDGVDMKFRDAYNIVKQEHPNINFIQEGRNRGAWKDQILTLVEGFQDYFLWATDDSLFYRPTTLTQDKLDWAFGDKGALSINLRMGLNVIWQNHWHSEKVPSFTVTDKHEDLIVWDATNISVNNDVGRVWQNDASIMPRELYLDRLMEETHWYKGAGCRALDNVGQSGGIFTPRIAAAFDQSAYLNVPVNLVHYLDNGRLYADNWGKFVRQDIHMLNDLFMEGKRIDWKSIDTEGLDCGRKEVEYTYETSTMRNAP